MKNVPFRYVYGRPYDENLPKLVATARTRAHEGDDYRLLIVGDTGTGKSMLMLWIYDLYAGEDATTKTVGLNEPGYRSAVFQANLEQRRGIENIVCVYDEANVYSTEVMTKFNNELMRLLGEIRGKHWLHIWSMPNPGRLQQDFIDETFDGMIYIYTKDKAHPRLYYFLSHASIVKMRTKEGSGHTKARISLDFLSKKAKKYADYKGCFKDYNGRLRADYDLLKESKMDERIASFSKVGEEKLYSKAEAARIHAVSNDWIDSKVNSYCSQGLMLKDVHYIINAAGNLKLTQEGINFLGTCQLSVGKKKKILQNPGESAKTAFSTPFIPINTRE